MEYSPRAPEHSPGLVSLTHLLITSTYRLVQTSIIKCLPSAHPERGCADVRHSSPAPAIVYSKDQIYNLEGRPPRHTHPSQETTLQLSRWSSRQAGYREFPSLHGNCRSCWHRLKTLCDFVDHAPRTSEILLQVRDTGRMDGSTNPAMAGGVCPDQGYLPRIR